MSNQTHNAEHEKRRGDYYAQAIAKASQEATNAKERARAIRLIGLCEIIHERNPEAEHLVIRCGKSVESRITVIDFAGNQIEQLFKTDEAHLEYSGHLFGTIDSVAKFAIDGRDAHGALFKFPVRSLAGKIPFNVDPEDFLKAEYAKEQKLHIKLRSIPHGMHNNSLFLSMDENLNVKEWADFTCHPNVGNDVDHPAIARMLTEAMREYCEHSTRTSWKWSRSYNIENGWMFSPQASMS